MVQAVVTVRQQLKPDSTLCSLVLVYTSFDAKCIMKLYTHNMSFFDDQELSWYSRKEELLV